MNQSFARYSHAKKKNHHVILIFFQRKEDIEIDIKHGHLDIVYDFETCNGFLCNAGKY